MVNLGGFGGGAATVAIVIKGVDAFSSVIAKATSGLKSFGSFSLRMLKNVALGFAGLTATVVASGVALFKFAEGGAKFESMMFALNKQTGNAEMLMKKLQFATAGTVSKFNLAKSASTALQLGLSKDALPVMAEFASKVAPALGESAEFMFDSIVRGVGRSSPLILDNLGLVIDTTKAYQDYADSQGISTAEIDKNTKLQIIQNKVLEEAKKRGMDLAGITDNTASRMLRFKASLSDLKTDIQTAFLPLVESMIDALTPFIIKIQENQDVIAVYVDRLKTGFGVAFDFVRNAISSVIGWFQRFQLIMDNQGVTSYKQLVMDAFTAIKTTVMEVIESLQGPFSETWASVKSFIIAAFGAIMQNKEQILGYFTNLIRIVGNVAKIFMTLVKWIAELGKWLIDIGLIDFMIQKFNTLSTVLTTVTGWVSDLLDLIGQVISKLSQSSFGKGIGKFLAGGLAKITAREVDVARAFTPTPVSAGSTGNNITVNIDTIQGIDSQQISSELNTTLVDRTNTI